MRLLLILVPVLLLSACNGRDDANTQGTSVNITGKGEDGKDDVQIKADGSTGKVAIKVPGFEGKVSLPKIMLDRADFDIDGVKLFPGSKVNTLNVNADNTGGKDSTKVHVAFTSPADVAKVAAYFREALAKRDIAVTGGDANLAGRTEDGEPFVIALAPGAAGQTSGTVTLDGK